MKKSSKIWKIETLGYPCYNGASLRLLDWSCNVINTQLIYESELDCLLDIVTEPENQGLKVYKHQIKEELVVIPETEKIFVLCEKESIDHSKWYFEEDKIPDGYQKVCKYEYSTTRICNMFKKYYWVEAFIQ